MMKSGLRFTMSFDEFSQLFRAWIAISVAFAILLNGGFTLDAEFLAFIVIAGLTVGTGFLLHEMGHKVVALRYGCKAEFKSFDMMLLLAVAMSFFGFVFAAPGAVFIQGKVNEIRNGIISAIGPIINILLGVLFFLAAIFFKGDIGSVALYGLMINGWLAIFNLIPFLDLDGAKVFRWSKPVYFSLVFFAFVLMLLPSLVKFF